ncbi:rhomboid family intramembrane serine protease GlpG [Pseudoalteromonas luteoviolacea]|uniref:GlpG protein n=1 Tax=Pseudoalteromonas luteoviolacea H33 TaxID=1365251 RepID=A0A167FNC7_9GAMM|nr:rhomboid family intramembrane serine protease GlpG [Pseudoalteromonas luteoviolacea]KZN52549.1 hypothetical protein N476_10825 [Pseudoalteromonas luteoviolacea H33]KZN76519.1 hypothetical protein N477_15530 [Pseudoalteromonas luteoviolacea H33-S]MBQ4877015.1 rhomboid family intramembrane serine protease GlpG [Pseudoalteromonas luteoviolacea]MBQ4905876.1 rhomboid family intramembrane serine protease GlpG [Pseudoalteromonas luteoviolacea]
MKLLGSFSDPRAVQGAVDYLRTLGVESQLHSEDGRTVSVWVQEQDLLTAQAIWQEFLDNPYHEKYSNASWQVGETDGVLKYQGTQLNLFQRFVRLNWLVQVVTIIALLVYISFYFFTPSAVFEALKFDINHPWSWLTPAFMHFGAVHLLFNLSWWVFLGNQIVNRAGFIILLSLFTVSALLSNWAQFLLVDENFGGLSGVVYAQMGFCWIYSYLNKDEQAILSKPMIGFMLVWMILGFTDVLFISMANWAHLVGLLTGMSLAAMMYQTSGKGTS